MQLPDGKDHMKKSLLWLGDTRHVLRDMPDPVKVQMGVSLYEVQQGGRPDNVRPLKNLGKGITGIHEIIVDHDKETYRGVYLLHVFHKKSKHGISIPREDVEKILSRYRQAVEHDKA